MKQTAVQWLKKTLEDYGSPFALDVDWNVFDKIIEQAIEMERDQIGYTKEDVIRIVEKSRETGLTAEYLMLSLQQKTEYH